LFAGARFFDPKETMSGKSLVTGLCLFSTLAGFFLLLPGWAHSGMISTQDEYAYIRYETVTRTVRDGNRTWTEEVAVPRLETRKIGTVFRVSPVTERHRALAFSHQLSVEHFRRDRTLPEKLAAVFTPSEQLPVINPFLLDLARNSPDRELRGAAVTLLGVIGRMDEDDLKTLPPLLNLARTGSAVTRRTALELLERKVAAARDDDTLRHAVTVKTVDALRRNRDPETSAVLGELLAAIPGMDQDRLNTLEQALPLAAEVDPEARAIFTRVARGLAR
jgi:hypothetical protein